MSFDCAVRTFVCSFPGQGLHHFGFHGGLFDTAAILRRRNFGRSSIKRIDDRERILTAIKQVGGETNPIGIR